MMREDNFTCKIKSRVLIPLGYKFANAGLPHLHLKILLSVTINAADLG